MYTFEIPNWVLGNVVGILVGLASLPGVFMVLKYRSNRKREFARLLPGPWKNLYDLLNKQKNPTRKQVLFVVEAFKRGITDIPVISPVGFDHILGVSYGRGGDCHQEFINLLGEYVKFSEIWDV